MKPVNSLLALLTLPLVTFCMGTPTPQNRTPIPCGIQGLPSCPYGQTCITNPIKPDCSISAECPGICATLDGPRCGGWLMELCPDPSRQTCIDDPRDACDPQKNSTAVCNGVCVHSDGSAVGPGYPLCDSFSGLKCPQPDQICVEDPRSGCEYGSVDCFGICVGPELSDCAGLPRLQCPDAGQICIDDPRDDCHLEAGDIDCGGICV